MINEKKTPEDFGYYIREAENRDEATILITARNKMRSARNHDVTIRISGDYKETSKLSINVASRNSNLIEKWFEKNKLLFDSDLLIKDAPKEVAERLLLEYAYGSYNQLNLSVSKEALNNFDKFDIKIGARLGASIDFNSIKEKAGLVHFVM